MESPIVVALSDGLREEIDGRLITLSPRLRVAWVSAAGEPHDDVSAAEVLFRGGGLTPRGVRRLLPLMPRLRWLHVAGAGVDSDLVPSVVEGDVIVTRTRGNHPRPMSEWVMMQILAVTKRLPEFMRAQTASEWRPLDVPYTISGRTLGIIGYGEIGQALAVRARAFGMRVVGLRRHPRPAAELDACYGPAQLDTLLAESDYVALLTPLTPETRGLIGAAQLAAMKPTAWLINLARGEVTDEAALLRALQDGTLAGAALDVFTEEPLPATSPFWRLPNVLLTPHNAGVKDPAVAAMAVDQFLENLGRYARGEPPRNQVDKRAGY